MESIKFEVELTTDHIARIAKQVAKINGKEKLDTLKEEIIKEHFTLKEVAKKIAVSEQTLKRHIKAGILKSNKPGKSHLITTENLNKYLNNE